MTDPRTVHLDDETLSGYLDGQADDRAAAAAHLSGCASCRARLDEFASVAAQLGESGRSEAPMTAAAVERLLAGSFDRVVVAFRPRRPPLVWLAAAAAAIVLVAGVGSALRIRQSHSSTTALDALSKTQADSAAENATVAAVGSSDSSAVNGGDIGDQNDPDVIARLADSALTHTTAATAAGSSASAVGAASSGQSPTAAAAGATKSAVPTTVPAAYATAPTALCETQARAIARGRLGPLRYVAVLRWKGQPAELLVFDLHPESQSAPTRQAYVLARPGCGVLADPRF